MAHCDLAAYLHEMDALQTFLKPSNWIDQKAADRIKDEAQSAVEVLCAFWQECPKHSPVLSSVELEALVLASQRRLCRSFLCISEAVAYLHHHNIRYKDLKPSQILLSPYGLWLTDFGWSIDMSMYSHSATSNGEDITFRYQAPERASKRQCSRSEDIFSLGCTFLEMAIRLTDSPATTIDSWRSSTGGKWSFQANLWKLEAWMIPLHHVQEQSISSLSYLIRKMMSDMSRDRPTIAEIIEALSYLTTTSDSPYFYTLPTPCCPPRKEVSMFGRSCDDKKSIFQQLLTCWQTLCVCLVWGRNMRHNRNNYVSH